MTSAPGPRGSEPLFVTNQPTFYMNSALTVADSAASPPAQPPLLLMLPSSEGQASIEVSVVPTCTTIEPKSKVADSVLCDHVDRIRANLGLGVVLLPIPYGQKAPNTNGWQKTTLADTLVPAYQNRLHQTNINIGVLLGAPSGHICTVDIDEDEQVEPFLALLPVYRTAPRTKGKRGCQIWFRMSSDDYPPTGKLKNAAGKPCGEWRANGAQSVVYGRHPDGMDYHWEVDGPIQTVAFDDLIFPADWELPWGDRAYREGSSGFLVGGTGSG